MLNRHFEFQQNHREQIFMSPKLQEACKILGLENLPTLGQLRRSYKEMVKQWHPDRHHANPEMEQVAVTKTQQINFAYRLLLKTLEKSPESTTDDKKGNKRHQYSWQTYTDGFPNPRVIEFYLNSSHIISAGYDKVRRILYIKFLGDEIYLYYDVPGFMFEHLLVSSSPGKYAMKFIYDRFRYRKFTPLIRR